MTLMVPGYDGNPPVLEELRDIAGRGKRETTRLHRYDTIGWLFRHAHIESHHEQAARRLQRDAEQAELGRVTGEPTGGVSGRAFTLSDHKIAAMERHASARSALKHALGPLDQETYQLINLVVIGNHTLSECAAIMKQSRRGMVFGLRVALSALARHYGMA